MTKPKLVIQCHNFLTHFIGKKDYKITLYMCVVKAVILNTIVTLILVFEAHLQYARPFFFSYFSQYIPFVLHMAFDFIMLYFSIFALKVRQLEIT